MKERIFQTNDLAEGMRGRQGPFLAQHGGQCFIGVAKPGHSITSLRPVGRIVNEPLLAISLSPPWTVTMLDDIVAPLAEGPA